MFIVVGDPKYCKRSQETLRFSLSSIIENVFLKLKGLEYCMYKNCDSSPENNSKGRTCNPKS